MQREQDRCGRSLIHLAAFEVHDAILEHVNASDGMNAAKFVEDRHEFEQGHSLPIHRHGHAGFVREREDRGIIWSLTRRHIPDPDIVR